MEQTNKISNEITKADTLWDVIVVGSGLGGIALSILLARLGYRILVIERNAVGHFRVGESLDWEAPIFLKS
ncbi:MAG: NAD(P)-binding protein [Blastocatellia bacterium]|nr:NAD(P)-binding protein [Blastocatellia bacterium]